MATWRDDIVAALGVLGGIGGSTRKSMLRSRRADPNYRLNGRRQSVARSNRRLPTPQTTNAALLTADPELSAQQGYASDSVVRAEIEKYAIAVAINYYEAVGAHDIEVLGKPYDLKMHLDGNELHVEVKGSTRPLHSVTLTRNEVADARATGTNHLFVLDQIKLTTDQHGRIKTSGGLRRLWSNWMPSDESLTPMVYMPPAAIKDAFRILVTSLS